METAHHHRNVSVAETHYSLPVNLIIVPIYFECLEWGRGSREEKWWQGGQRSLQNHYFQSGSEISGFLPLWLIRKWPSDPGIFPTFSQAIMPYFLDLLDKCYGSFGQGSMWLKILCHCPHQKAGGCSFPALWIWARLCRSAMSSSAPSLMEHSHLGHSLEPSSHAGRGPSHTHRGPQPVSIGSPVGEPSWPSQPCPCPMTSRAAAQGRPGHTKEPVTRENKMLF